MKDDNLKDRGSIKWTAMMLPEHVGLLRELESNQNKVKKPVLDMSQIEDMEMIISEAMEFNNPVQFSVFKPLPFVERTGNRGNRSNRGPYTLHKPATQAVPCRGFKRRHQPY
ncbi:YolD-like family protein [Bacillus swezeyi]|nr:YolD-like family protein [Bacillus swezeyi]MED2979465.1 YolD-like family protein [Bacillus swezeyi]